MANTYLQLISLIGVFYLVNKDNHLIAYFKMRKQSLLSYLAFNNYESMKLNINYKQSGKTLLYAAIFYLILFFISTFMMGKDEQNKRNIDPYDTQVFASRPESFVDMFREDVEKESKFYFYLIFKFSEETFIRKRRLKKLIKTIVYLLILIYKNKKYKNMNFICFKSH